MCSESARFLYAGTDVQNRQVLTTPGKKYSNVPFYETTGLTQFPYYFVGSGYVVSGPLARAITRPAAADQPPLQFWTLQDGGRDHVPLAAGLQYHPAVSAWARRGILTIHQD
jgi:hypothetical protein